MLNVACEDPDSAGKLNDPLAYVVLPIVLNIEIFSSRLLTLSA